MVLIDKLTEDEIELLEKLNINVVDRNYEYDEICRIFHTVKDQYWSNYVNDEMLQKEVDDLMAKMESLMMDAEMEEE